METPYTVLHTTPERFSGGTTEHATLAEAEAAAVQWASEEVGNSARIYYTPQNLYLYSIINRDGGALTQEVWK